jgi:hypothetical protein
MAESAPPISSEWPQYRAFVYLALVAAGAAGILDLTNGREFFRPYFGGIDPLLAVAVATAVGGVCLPVLGSRGWFEIYERRKLLKGVVVSALFATFLVIPVIAVDFAAGIQVVNVPPPWSLSFYPAIAFVVEVFFHALPLAILTALLGLFFERPNPKGLVWACILLVSFLEPTFQLQSGLVNQSLSLIEAYVWLHVWAINLLQLYVFSRFGFVSMYSFRFVYYLYWHILWGYLRLQLEIPSTFDAG